MRGRHKFIGVKIIEIRFVVQRIGIKFGIQIESVMMDDRKDPR